MIAVTSVREKYSQIFFNNQKVLKSIERIELK